MHAWESIQKSLDYIEEHLTEDIPTEKLADIATLSMFYYQRLFVRLVKKPVQEYIKLRRLAKAAKALENKAVRILDVALENGFSSHETFTRAFKDAYGFTPSQYRDHPMSLNHFNKPDLLLGHVMVDEGAPLISDGMILEMNRRTLTAPIHFCGVRDYIRMDWYRPDGKVTGVDDPGETWRRFHQVKQSIPGVPGGRMLGVSYGGDAPKGHFSYFAGKEVENEVEMSEFHNIKLYPGPYVVCGFEAEDFEELVTNAIHKASNFATSWIKKHGIIFHHQMSELYFPSNTDTAYMELWYPINERAEESTNA